MRNGLNIQRDPGAEGGGGSAASPSPAASGAPAAAAAPSASPQAGSPGVPSGAPGAAAPGGAAQAAAPAAGAAPAAAPAFKSSLEGLPQRGTAEYMKAFNDLPRERQQAIEQEVLDRELNPKKYEDLDKQGKPAAPAENPDGTVELGWTEEQLAALDPHTQASIKAMQGIIDQVAPYVQDGQLNQGMQVLINDPVVKARMAEISKGADPYAIPEDLEEKFDPSEFMTAEELSAIDLQLKPKESREMLASSLQKAYEAGAKNAAMKAEYEKNGAVAFERRKSLFTTQLDKLQASNPSLKSDKPLSDPNHPLNPYVKWAGENLGDDFLESHGQEVGYAAYLASSGRMQETLKAVATRTQLAFVRAVENGDRKVAMLPPGGKASPAALPNADLGGVDPQKYKTDATYRRNAFAAATPDVRRKLEVLSATGKL